jgi:hypothetical protein
MSASVQAKAVIIVWLIELFEAALFCGKGESLQNRERQRPDATFNRAIRIAFRRRLGFASKVKLQLVGSGNFQ